MNELDVEDWTQILCTILGLIAAIIFLVTCLPVAVVIIIYNMGKAASEN